MPEWDAEIVVDEALVRVLLAEQFPELDASSARLLGEGWDNSVWVVEERWAFRFPRREIAIAGVRARARGAAATRAAPPRSDSGAAVRRGDRTSASPGRSSARRSFSARGRRRSCLDDRLARISAPSSDASSARCIPGNVPAVDAQRCFRSTSNRRADMPYRVAVPGASSSVHPDGSLAPSGARRAHPHRGT